MSKNTANTRFRKVNVDEYNEDNFKEEDVEDTGAQGPNEGEVQGLLSQYPLSKFWHWTTPIIISNRRM